MDSQSSNIRNSTTRKILFASHNKSKIAEVKELFKGLQFELVTLDEFPSLPEVEETGSTFEENAILKARAGGLATGLLTLAEDSGLEVDALGGRPGVFSARYAPGTNIDRCKKLLEELKDVPDEKRGAQFHAVVAIYDPATGKIRTCEGIQRGTLLREFRGDNGFGYDPIFYSEELGKTNAETTMSEKSTVSHRGIALRGAIDILTKEY